MDICLYTSRVKIPKGIGHRPMIKSWSRGYCTLKVHVTFSLFSTDTSYDERMAPVAQWPVLTWRMV